AAKREEWSGVSLGLGAAAKLYPALLVLPLFLQGLRDRQPDRSVRILWWSFGTWLAVNLPFAIVAPQGWIEFYRFNGERPADFDSLWYIAADRWSFAAFEIRTINIASAALFVGGLALVWWIKARLRPGFPPWTLGFPILVVFLLTNKVYSPQYGLWLLPWFALTIPSLRIFALFEVVDVAVFLTRFRFFGDYVGEPWGWPESWFQIAVLVRAAVLVVALVSWIRAEGEPLEIRFRSRTTVPAPADPEAVPA
ncbi:MAG: glycosyltransferase 87 family protein, partial [Actinomycetota bacterium]